MEMDLEVGDASEDSMRSRSSGSPDDESNGTDSCDEDSGSDDGKSNGVDLHEAHRLLAQTICSSEVRISAMLDFSNMLNPDVKLDHDMVKANCLEIYEKEKVKVKNFFRSMEGKISLSVDVLNHGYYMCLSAHFIDDSWKPRKWVLRFQHVSNSENDTISEAILKTLKDWEIEDKVSTFTSSSLAEDEVDECTENVKTRIQTVKNLQLNGRLFRVNCCAAMFNQMANDAFKEISGIIDKVSLLSSWKSPPLWYLTTHKLKMALELEALGEDSRDTSSDYDIPSSDEWKKVEVICKLTEKVYSIAKVLFETKYPTINIYLSNMQELQDYLILESNSLCSLTSNVAKMMLTRLDKYRKSVFLLLGIASVLDPRYKMKYIEYLGSRCEESDGSLEVAHISDAIHNLYADYVKNIVENEIPMDVSDSSSSEEEEEERETNEEHIPSWVEDYNQFAETDNKPKKSDLEWYLEEPVVTWSQDFNVLNWWRANSPRYPTLSKMARDVLGVPMSVATSTGAYCTQPREAKLGSTGPGRDLQNALMCTRSWLEKKVGNYETCQVPALAPSFFCF